MYPASPGGRALAGRRAFRATRRIGQGYWPRDGFAEGEDVGCLRSGPRAQRTEHGALADVAMIRANPKQGQGMAAQRILMACMLWSVSTLSLASGVCLMLGENADGTTVSVNTEGALSVTTWTRQSDPVAMQRSARSFPDEPCHYDESDDGRGKPQFRFNCAATGKSPLAGTRYQGVLHGQGEASQVRWSCVAGCDGNRKAPKTLRQGRWEC